MISLHFETPASFGELKSKEWIETNGLGGWASSTIISCHTRRYHGLLVAATKPPTERIALVSKLDETLVVNGERYELGVNDYGEAIHPQGYQYLKSFTKNLYPEFEYEAGGVRLRKSILMVHEENTTLIKYEVLKADESFTLELVPLLSVRGYHQLTHANDAVNKNARFEDGQLQTTLYNGTPTVFIHAAGSDYHPNPFWFYHFNYSIEKYRGLDFVEDLFHPGTLSVELKEGDTAYIILSTEDSRNKNAAALFEKEVERRRSLLKNQPKDPTLQQLILAADQFIVKRNVPVSPSTGRGRGEAATIIAGYHWFTDWGRDTMISLPGLCLCTKRFDDAKKILYAFAQSVDQGMLPNRFQDNGEAPEYNNVDGTLQYFIALYKYYQATVDKAFIQDLLPVLKDIIDWHFNGTRYNIHVDEDGLLYAGEKGYQLTWMDARIGDWVVTPRMGKPVEIQALWYNALKIYSEFLSLNKQTAEAEEMAARAFKAKESFLKKFWYAQGEYLYDVIDENNQPDATLRPNQLFAISLPFALVENGQAKSIVRIVEEKLYTPKGLRSLSPDDNRYAPHYGGDAWHRDSVYHQGTVWSWLLGPYVDALFRTNGSSAARTKSLKVIQNFLPHLSEAGIGTVSEIFDAEPPHAPRGCMAQAWSVAEILRVIKTYHLHEQNVKYTRQQMMGELL
ncbi:MAG: glycogen debranching enzyme family protein [Flavisolibacter sp.]|nr:glycogen debranching enzyme family protein [Flavisolibacter sp.]